ncbi:MAG: hypothetical protein V2I33_08170 [Kangiellaceae bacterium]|jgi:hypothetical protein|nr:hypothetical protein [Kangiellaceae bacterium]
MSTYDYQSLMSQTRQLASQYRAATGQSLPVTIELARFDAITLLNLEEIAGSTNTAYFNLPDGKLLAQIKGRVIFSGGKSRERVGQLDLAAAWDLTLLVIYNSDYNPTGIYAASRAVIEDVISQTKSNKRGAMTVAKFKAISELIWQPEPAEQIMESSDITNE